MHRCTVIALVASAALQGCSSGGGVSTASILGDAPTPPPAVAGAEPAAPAAVAAPLAPQSTPTDRAFKVGSVTARAVKCGYNFDPAKLKANYIAYEIGRGTPNDHIASIEKIHGVAYNGVMKAAAEDPNYCSPRKTATIKDDLGRLLAGDFEAPAKAVVAQKKDDGGFFSGWFDGSSQDSGPSFGSSDWWDKQAEKAGK